MKECIFCAIVQGEAPAHIIAEDERHLAFLSIFPNTEGFSVVIPKEHYDSYFADTSAEVVNELMVFAQSVAKKLDATFPDVGRTGLIFEGFGVNHLHAKLVPLHGTKEDEWKAHRSELRTFYAHYPGYIASHDGERADDDALAALAARIKGAR